MLIGEVLVLQDKTELWFRIATRPPLIPLPKLCSFIEFEIQIMRTTDSEIGSTFSQKSENQGFSSHYINFRISPVWRRISRQIPESSPNLSSQLLLVSENEQKDGFGRIWELLCRFWELLCRSGGFSFSKTKRSWGFTLQPHYPWSLFQNLIVLLSSKSK